VQRQDGRGAGACGGRVATYIFRVTIQTAMAAATDHLRARRHEREPDEHPGTGRACTGCASRFGLRRQRRSQADAVVAAPIPAARVAALTPAPSV
jgi:hypothetical protein